LTSTSTGSPAPSNWERRFRNANRLDRQPDCYALTLAKHFQAMGSAKYQVGSTMLDGHTWDEYPTGGRWPEAVGT
jgi:hypothetical protein